jgi:Zn-dependent peptidase ImmA (M78 family)
MSPPIPAKIQPSLLIWARETAGYSLDDAASKLNVTAKKLQASETGKDTLTFLQLQSAAKLFKRPLALFFLPKPPPRETATHDFRLDRDSAHVPLSPAVNIELRIAAQRRDEALSLVRELEMTIPSFNARASLSEDVVVVATRIAHLLGINEAQGRAWKDASTALKARKAAVEAQGVLVFEASRVPTEMMRGAALSFEQLPVVVLNGADAYTGRSFTLMHEVTHLLIRQGGVCDLAPSDDQTPEAKVERFCNAVAATVLMPADQIEARLDGVVEIRDWTLDELGSFAKHFWVSREALLIRLITLGRASQQQYIALRPQFREEYLRLKDAQRKKNSGGGPAPAVIAVRNLGHSYVRLVLDAYEEDRIDLSTASDYLGVKVRHLPRIRELTMKSGVAA